MFTRVEPLQPTPANGSSSPSHAKLCAPTSDCLRGIYIVSAFKGLERFNLSFCPYLSSVNCHIVSSVETERDLLGSSFFWEGSYFDFNINHVAGSNMSLVT